FRRAEVVRQVGVPGGVAGADPREAEDGGRAGPSRLHDPRGARARGGLPREFLPALLPPAEADVRRERGVALVLVMWVAILLTVIASSFMLEARTDTLVVRNSLGTARAEAAADAGVYRSVYELFRTDNGPDQWRRDGGS